MEGWHLVNGRGFIYVSTVTVLQKEILYLQPGVNNRVGAGDRVFTHVKGSCLPGNFPDLELGFLSLETRLSGWLVINPLKKVWVLNNMAIPYP